MTLTRLIGGLPEPAVGRSPRVLGVDEFALRRGHTHGTLLVNDGTGQRSSMLAADEAYLRGRWADSAAASSSRTGDQNRPFTESVPERTCKAAPHPLAC